MTKTLYNNKEINQKLFKYMNMHFANKSPYFPYMKKYIANSVQEELAKLKLHFLVCDEVNEYKKRAIPADLTDSVKQKLNEEIDFFIDYNKRKEQKQYINYIYQYTKKKKKIVKNVCFLSGRSRAVYRAFHLSRLKIREHAQHGQFIGFKKISW